MKSRFIALMLAGISVAVLVACGGDKNSSDAGSSASRTSSNASSLNVGQVTSNLAELKSFRFDAHLKLDLGDFDLSSLGEDEDEFGAAFGALFMGLLNDVSIEGAVVAPDQAQFKVNLGGQVVEFIQIGQKAWIKQGSTWLETSASNELTMGLGSSPMDLASQFLPQQVLSGAKTSKERVNGVDTTHYAFDKAALEEVARSLGESTTGAEDLTKANLDIWLTEQNVPAKLAVDVQGKDESGQQMGIQLTLNVKDINSSSITIKPPV